MTTTTSCDGSAMLMRGKSTTCRKLRAYSLRVFNLKEGL
jgi:hypothetical protein